MGVRGKISVRTRFSIFKRDKFTCRYCGMSSPDVVLELDHIIPVASGGTDDEMNLATSCAQCNSGKSNIPLDEVMTGEDPHDKAIELLEHERQMREYTTVRERIWKYRTQCLDWIIERCDPPELMLPFIKSALETYAVTDVLEAVKKAIHKTNGGYLSSAKYFCGIIRSWKDSGGPK